MEPSINIHEGKGYGCSTMISVNIWASTYNFGILSHYVIGDQRSQILHCSHTQNGGLDEGSDQFIALLDSCKCMFIELLYASAIVPKCHELVHYGNYRTNQAKILSVKL